MGQLDFPYHFDRRGRTAESDGGDHIRDLIEQVLFTIPGERPNRPTFGSDVSKMLFAPNNPAAAPAIQLAVQGALLQALGELIIINSVDVEAVESSLTVTVRYTVRTTQETQVMELTRHA